MKICIQFYIKKHWSDSNELMKMIKMVINE